MVQGDKSPFLAGDWLVTPELNALERGGVEHHIEPKVMQVLVVLASRQSHVFSKSELIATVWPDTFVSDDVLTRCISILRRVTADDPQAPKFIQTVPKVGYRLVASVHAWIPTLDRVAEAQPLTPPLVEEPTPVPQAAAHPEVIPREDAAPPPPEPPVLAPLEKPSHQRRPQWHWLVLIALLLAGGTAVLHTLQARREPAPAPATNFRVLPLTSYAGQQTEPAFSPDETSIALVRTAEDGSTRRIYTKRLEEQTGHELTTAPGEQFSPAWSPDGRQIAYFARSDAGSGLYVATVGSAEPPRKLYTPQEPSDWANGALSWSPDGGSIVFPDHKGVQPYSQILRLDVRTLQVVPLTSPPPGWEGDLNPAYSPDGRRIAFTRASETAVRELCWMSLSDGVVHPLTADHADIDGLAWMRDGSGLVYSSNIGGQYALWRISLAEKAPERLPVGTENATQPAIGLRKGLLSYVQGGAVWSIDRLGADAVLTSTQEDSAPSLSPDGQQFAFQSRRSGTQQIWVSSIDGRTLRQLTEATGPMAGSPSWSHKGDLLLFDARPADHSHIFSIPAAGGQARQLTFGNGNDIVPRWSQDDRSIYFRSNRGGHWQLWKLALDDMKPVPVTTGDGMAPQESFDGRSLFYTRGDEAGVWQLLLGSNIETKVLSQPAAGNWGYMQMTRKGVLYLDTATCKPGCLRLYDVGTRHSRLVAPLQHAPPPYQGLSATSAGDVVLLTGEREAERHLTIVDGYIP